MYHMDSLKFIEEEVVDDASAGGGGFPSLEELSLRIMPNLEGWSKSSSSSFSSSSLAQASPITQQIAAVFPCLKSVTLERCPNLKGGIPLAWSPVQHVDIDGGNCNGMVLGSLRDLPSLPSLRIYGFQELEYFPSGTIRNLIALQKLKINQCRRLRALPVELYSLATLTELEIWSCPNLVSLADEREGGLKNLSSLKTLVIDSCEALKRLPELDHLVVLEQLILTYLPKLTCFPEGIKHSAATLRRLHFQPAYGEPVDLPDWIGTTLTSLEYLEIDAPKNWKVLPQWMQHLTALKTLKIRLYNEELVEQWKTSDMVSHIPVVEVYTLR